MKKTALILLPLAAVAILSGCGQPNNAKRPSDATPPQNKSVEYQRDESQIPVPLPFPDPKPRVKINISGVRRHFIKSLAGNYSVEYIHSAGDNVNLDCKLTVNEDNTYEMSFSKNGSTVEHSGKWYSRHGNVTFFFDEEKPTYIPEVYYPDSMSADVIDGGKLMLYDGCCVIVLSQENAATYNG
ncbi:MAG: hypothetical protein J1F39_04260 [Clostridiales bacterium]|nr:hypothetical protein [Clostridiales bacterium]